MKKRMMALAILLLTLFSTGCLTETIQYDVYVTVYPLQYVTEQMFVSTPYIVGIVPGVTSHQDSVDWSPKEIIAMTEASYLFYVGANYDQYIDLQIESIFTSKNVELVKIEEQSDYITYIPGIIDDHAHDETSTALAENPDTLGLDPHFWISPLQLLKVADLIHDKLVLAYPEYVDTLDANYADLVTRLTALSDDFAETIAHQTKDMMTSTNLYGYLRNDYGLDYISVSPGYHEETEQFTTTEKEEIVQEAILHNITSLFYEKYTTSPLTDAVFAELANLGYNPVKVEYNILQALSDELRSEGEDYISIMEQNLAAIALAITTEE